MKNYFLSIIAGVLPLLTIAQDISVNNTLLDDAFRRGQLLGKIPLENSLCIRPVSLTKAYHLDGHSSGANYWLNQTDLADSDTIFPVTRGWLHSVSLPNVAYRKKITTVTPLPLQSKLQYNSHHAYGWQDGPMIPNKGFQLYSTGGVYAKIGLFETQFSPEFVFAQNQDLRAPAVRPFQADFPDRFGTDSYTRNYMGQSFVRAQIGIFSTGLSTENVQWGPGGSTNLLLSNNSPGFAHFHFNTSTPLRTKWGSFEGQIITGKLKHSGFLYTAGPNVNSDPLPEVYRVEDLDTGFRVFTGAIGVFNPKILPGLSLGVIRILWTDEQPFDPNFLDYLKLLYSNPFRGSGGGTQPVDQMASLFFRYAIPKGHAEVYGEYGFDDNRYDLEDWLVSPEHSRGYTLGFRKITPISRYEYWDFVYEITQCEGSKEMLNRRQFGYPLFYDGNSTNYGQMLGSGIGSGSNQWILKLEKAKGLRRIGGVFERVNWNVDNLYTGRTPWLNTWYGFDFTKKWVDASLGLTYQEKFGPFILSAKGMVTQTYNWNYWYSPTGGGDSMRSFGWNLKHLNVFIQAQWLL